MAKQSSGRAGPALGAAGVTIQRTLMFALLLLSGGGLVWLNAGRRYALTVAAAGIGLGLWLLTIILPELEHLLGLMPLPLWLNLLVLLASGLFLLLAALAPDLLSAEPGQA